ncbi:acyltransferase domain-containing protein [Butyrivibrio proteoclasticus]|uniref:acyltransferase domain-containing protein n=1 Tax=Butyrivibrio proteoclasticus TaxID=43305 RepID=UPI00047EB6DD|nr:acyltransferase domain-containing protein [Butyrivibrio proteoclasticus]
MNKTGYEKLIKDLGVGNVPESFPKFYEEWNGEGSVLTRDELWQILGRYDLSADQVKELESYLQTIRESQQLTEYIKFLTYCQCDKRYDYYIDDNTDFNPGNVGDVGKTVSFFMCLSCIGYAKRDLVKRGIYEKLYEDIPHRMLRMHMEKFKKTGSYELDDLPWQSNFYSLAIYLFDRFLFVPCRFDDPYTFYRNGNEVIGIADDGLSVDFEGQLILPPEDGTDNTETSKTATIDSSFDTNTIKKDGHYYGAFKKDRKEEFKTIRTETDTEVTGYRISPCGFITKELVTLDKGSWKQILKRDDWLLGFHIPSGEGYVPERVRSSMKPAWEFFCKYYPEIPFKGFWSASWLYDGRLSLLLPDDSNIVRTQRHLFNYSGGWNGEMLYLELYGDCDIPLAEVPKKTSLQRNVATYLERGGKFCEPGMVYFPEELSKDCNQMIYITDKDLEDQRKLFKANGIKGINETDSIEPKAPDTAENQKGGVV